MDHGYRPVRVFLHFLGGIKQGICTTFLVVSLPGKYGPCFLDIFLRSWADRFWQRFSKTTPLSLRSPDLLILEKITSVKWDRSLCTVGAWGMVWGLGRDLARPDYLARPKYGHFCRFIRLVFGFFLKIKNTNNIFWFFGAISALLLS